MKFTAWFEDKPGIKERITNVFGNPECCPGITLYDIVDKELVNGDKRVKLVAARCKTGIVRYLAMKPMWKSSIMIGWCGESNC